MKAVTVNACIIHQLKRDGKVFL